MKVRVLGCQPRRRKDRCSSTYCRGKKIRAGTEFQHSPPANVADCFQHECNTVVEKKRRSLALHVRSTDLIQPGRPKQEQVPCHPARPRISYRPLVCAGLERVQAHSMPSSNFIARARWTTVFSPSTRPSKCGHSRQEIVSRSGIQTEKRTGFCLQYVFSCGVAHRMLGGNGERGS